MTDHGLEAARTAREQANCRRSTVGAAIVHPGVGIIVGANGTVDGRSCVDGGCPRGLLDYDEAPLGTPSAGDAKCVGVHAEMAAILTAAQLGVALPGATMYVTKKPCRTCARHIGLTGISSVIVDQEQGP